MTKTDQWQGKFNQTATLAILYFKSLAAGDKVQVTFRLRAMYPIRARTFQSRVSEYYDPDVSSLLHLRGAIGAKRY